MNTATTAGDQRGRVGTLENPEVHPHIPGRVIPILEREFDDFDAEAQKFLDGETDRQTFMGFRLRQGVYGQRQPDVQMIRVKLPFGGFTPDQFDTFAEIAETYAPLKKGHITTRQNVQFHFIPLLISVDVQPGNAALASGAIGVMQVVGRTIFAPVERRFSSRTMAIGVFVLLTISLAILLLGSAAILIVLFVALFGMAIGTHTLTRPLIVADTYGVAYYGRVSSSMVIFLTLAGTASPFAAGVLFDLFGSYNPMLILAAGFSIISTVLIWLLPKDGLHKPQPRKSMST